MFSGIVTDLGRVVDVVSKGKEFICLNIEAPVITGRLLYSNRSARMLHIGDSVSVNGICLTVVDVFKKSFSVEVMQETLRVTTAGSWKKGTIVNLEPALRMGDSLGGHLVTGHIDGTAKIIKEKKAPLSRVLELHLPSELKAGIVPKGSITVDGVSLTVAALKENSFEVALIPHTLKVTNFGKKKVGDKVNLETDMIGKFVVRYLEESFLQEGEKLATEIQRK